MEIHSRAINGAAVIAIQGEVDLYSSPKLRREIVHWAEKETHPLVLDLGAVNYMDSSGIATLVEGFQLVTTYNGALHLVRPGPTIQEVLRFAHLDKIFPIFSTIEEALDGRCL